MMDLFTFWNGDWWEFGSGNQQLFQKMHPNEEFFPEIGSPENPEDDDTGLTLETWKSFFVNFGGKKTKKRRTNKYFEL